MADQRGVGVLSAAVLALVLGGSVARAGVIVNDTWQDATRNDPASTYSENGTDSDGDGNIESAWFGTSGQLSVSSGHLTMTQPAGSASYTTYFTPATSPITLATAGDQLKITWVFTPNGVNSASTGQGFRLAVVDWPESGTGSLARQTADGNPGSAAYTGYALFGNMRTGTLGNGNSFQLLKRTDPTTASALLSASASWTATDLTNSTVNNTSTPGYTDGAQLTFVMTFTRNAANGLDITATMTGAGLGANNQGFLFQSATDANPASFTFDTFTLRPSTAADTATTFDTTLFKVETSTTAPVPEPASLGVLALGGLALLMRRRRA
jgi:hypothetical protein